MNAYDGFTDHRCTLPILYGPLLLLAYLLGSVESLATLLVGRCAVLDPYGGACTLAGPHMPRISKTWSLNSLNCMLPHHAYHTHNSSMYRFRAFSRGRRGVTYNQVKYTPCNRFCNFDRFFLRSGMRIHAL
jgi:hypothetical protein